MGHSILKLRGQALFSMSIFFVSPQAFKIKISAQEMFLCICFDIGIRF